MPVYCFKDTPCLLACSPLLPPTVAAVPTDLWNIVGKILFHSSTSSQKHLGVPLATEKNRH